jgi:hypothetical protein
VLLAFAMAIGAAASPACGGRGAEAPKAATRELATPFASALREEATGDPAAATSQYLAIVDHAAAASADPWQVPALAAALDALVIRSVPALASVTPRSALAFRTNERNAIDARLRAALAKADGPFARSLLAHALERLAADRGDAAEAEQFRTARGCAREATVTGPLAWASLSALHGQDALQGADADAKLATAYAAPGPFAIPVAPVVVRDRGCAIDLSAASAQLGVRAVLVDVEVPAAQTIGLTLRTRGAAVVHAGGARVLERPYELGGAETTRFARIDTAGGRLRVVVRVAAGHDDDTVEIAAFDEHGAPLRTAAPAPGSSGSAKATLATRDFAPPPPRTAGERLLAAAGSLALGDGRTAERLLAEVGRAPDAPPDVALLYGRAVQTSFDLPKVQRAERARGAYGRVLEAWPAAWEAILAHAELAAVRRGQGDARIEALKDLDEHRSEARGSAGVLDAYDAATSAAAGIYDRARAAFARSREALRDAPLVHDVEQVAYPRAGDERIAQACDPKQTSGRGDFDCYFAHRDAGHRKEARAELDRLRALRGGASLYLAEELRDALGHGDREAAARVFGRMLPGEQTLSAFAALRLEHAGGGASGAADDAKRRAAIEAILARAAQDAPDAPAAIAPLLRAAGHDPLEGVSDLAERVAAEDRARPFLRGAATAILAHEERYEVAPSGLVHARLVDVRRVSGTTDVDQNAQADLPDIDGRTALRVVRRRILKRDGRILSPDRTPNAAQAHAELAQLEQGDVVEAIYEVWALPGETGDVGISTPDLLPARTAVHEATIELVTPASLRASLWAHALLGKPTERRDGDRIVRTWTMKNRAERRLEIGAPKMDQGVSVAFGTAHWSDVGVALAETVRALDETDPEVAAWAKAAAKGERGATLAAVRNVVEASGQAINEANAALLSDLGIGRADGAQTVTARTFLATKEGSRTWLVVRALRELGIRAEVVIAENEPFSADAGYPPRFGRFMHPLAVAYLPSSADAKGAGASAAASATTAVWIDADVAGPPLPAGRISPELRGRSFLKADGSIAPLPPVVGSDERDEVDIRLTLDDNGDARGTFTIVLRGRDAQEIAEALVRIVGEDRKRALRGIVLAWVPTANVEDVALSSTEGSWQVAVRARFTVEGYAQAESADAKSTTYALPGIDPIHYVFPRAYVTTLAATYASQGARESALAINQAVQYHVRRRIELPKSLRIARTPGAFALSGPTLRASRKLSVDGGVIDEDFVLELSTGTVDAERYGAFVRDAQKTDSAFLASVRVAKAAGATSGSGTTQTAPEAAPPR